MKYAYPLILLFVCSLCLSAQRGAPARVNKKWLAGQDVKKQNRAAIAVEERNVFPARGVSLHLMPFSFVNLLPRLRAGVQVKHKQLAFLLDLEYGEQSTNEGRRSNGFNVRNYRFYGARPEARYHLAPGSGFYVGLEVPISVMRRDLEGIFIRRTEGRLPVAEATQDRFRASGIGKIGAQVLLSEHILFDAYVGLGVGYQDSRYTNLGVYPASPFTGGFDWSDGDLPDADNHVVPEVALGVRIGWWF